MDENYLDSLLNEISLDNEIDDNPDTEMQSSSRDRRVELKEDAFDDMISKDSDTTLHVDDDILGKGQFDELDELDRMADFDMSDLSFDDLDFDDLDMTDTKKNDRGIKQSAKPSKKQREEDTPDIDFSDLAIDDMFFQDSKKESEEVVNEPEQTMPAEQQASEPEDFSFTDAFAEQTDNSGEDTTTMESMDDMDALSALFGGADVPMDDVSGDMPIASENAEEVKEESKVATSDNADMNDLFAMLGIQESDLQDAPEASADSSFSAGDDLGGLDFDQLFGDEAPVSDESQASDLSSEDINDILNASISETEAEIPQEKKMSKLATLLFGDDDDEEDVISDEELAAIKAEKKAKKDAKKAEKKAKAEEKKAAKNAKNAAAQSEKAAKAAVKAAKLKAELAAAPPEKKLNRKMVTAVLAFFLIFAAVVVFGTQSFNYSLVIRKATDYFERQKYHLAYDEIVGVEVKEEDQELEDRIYTVMYVERLYESYENNASLKRMDRALDCLLRGLTKYDEHYQEAVELGIVADIDYCRGKIVNALSSTYQLSVEDAYQILALDSYAYRNKMAEYAIELSDEEKISLDPNKTVDSSED